MDQVTQIAMKNTQSVMHIRRLLCIKSLTPKCTFHHFNSNRNESVNDIINQALSGGRDLDHCVRVEGWRPLLGSALSSERYQASGPVARPGGFSRDDSHLPAFVLTPIASRPPSKRRQIAWKRERCEKSR